MYLTNKSDLNILFVCSMEGCLEESLEVGGIVNPMQNGIYFSDVIMESLNVTHLYGIKNLTRHTFIGNLCLKFIPETHASSTKLFINGFLKSKALLYSWAVEYKDRLKCPQMHIHSIISVLQVEHTE